MLGLLAGVSGLAIFTGPFVGGAVSEGLAGAVAGPFISNGGQPASASTKPV